MLGKQIKLTLIIAHILFWVIVAIRVIVSRYRNSKNISEQTSVPLQKPGDVSPWRGLIFYTFFTFSYYLLVGIWWLNPSKAGNLVLPLTTTTGVLGIVCTIIGLIFMSWAYVYLNSFRFIAKIGAGHELSTDGPYKILRHPVYTGMSFFNIGCFLITPTTGFLVILAGLLTGSAMRAISEEKALVETFGRRYLDYMKKTYRLIPFIY